MDERDFMLAARKQGMDTDEYVYLLPDMQDRDGDFGLLCLSTNHISFSIKTDARELMHKQSGR